MLNGWSLKFKQRCNAQKSTAKVRIYFETAKCRKKVKDKMPMKWFALTAFCPLPDFDCES